MDREYFYLYPYSREEARRRKELDAWRDSYNENIQCKHAIESAAGSGDDMPTRLKGVLNVFGFKRVGFVLSNTLQQRAGEAGICEDDQQWGSRTFIPDNRKVSQRFTVQCAPERLSAFLRQYQAEYRKLGLFGPEHCETVPEQGLDYQGRVLIMEPRVLKERYWAPQDMLWLAHDGFGCSPQSRGRSIRATCLGDGEMTRWNRTDFIGAIKDEFLPDWAAEKLTQLQGQSQSAAGMTMC